MNEEASNLWDAWRTAPEIQQLAEAWVKKPVKKWTKEDAQITALFGTAPARALSILFAIMQQTEDAAILGALGAGRFAEFLVVRGEAYLDTIHSLALQHKSLRVVLDSVKQGAMQPRVWQTVQMLKQSAFS
jgi:hypothetical protein